MQTRTTAITRPVVPTGDRHATCRLLPHCPLRPRRPEPALHHRLNGSLDRFKMPPGAQFFKDTL